MQGEGRGPSTSGILGLVMSTRCALFEAQAVILVDPTTLPSGLLTLSLSPSLATLQDSPPPIRIRPYRPTSIIFLGFFFFFLGQDDIYILEIINRHKVFLHMLLLQMENAKLKLSPSHRV